MALILDSLEIHNFRGLKELCIDRLGRVNLLTGKNNVGKTSVLEALRLYANPGNVDVLIDLLRSKDQYADDLRWGSGLSRYYEIARREGMQPPEPLVVSQYIPAVGLGLAQIGDLWDRIALTSHEEDVLEALRLIDRNVERLILKPIETGSETRVPFVKLAGEPGPISLRSLGDGMNRLFGVALALVNAKDGFLLIDEVENGLHYSIQPDLWRLIFYASKQMNVQVFATTHSYDCVRAFDEAARGSEEEGVVIRLARKAGRIVVGEFDERELGIAVEGQIEVR